MKKAVMCIVENSAIARTVIDQLRTAGFTNDDISIISSDQHGTRDMGLEHSTKAPEGAVAGASAGAIVGGAVGVLAGIGLLAIPGIGPFIAAGPIMAGLSGIAAGGAVGGVAGGLVGMGIPEIEAKRYEGKLRDGNILMSVHVESAEETRDAKALLENAGATDVCVSHEAKVPNTTTETTNARTR